VRTKASLVRIAIAGVVLAPLAYLAVVSLVRDGRPSLEAYAGILDAPAPAILLRTVALALVATAVAFALGGAAAVTLESRAFPARRAVRLLALAPLLLPPVFHVAAWEAVLLPGGPLGTALAPLSPLAPPGPSAPSAGLSIRSLPFAAWILGLSYSPLTFFFVGAGVRSVGAEPVEAASLARRPVAVWLRVVLPLAAPHALAGAGIVFALSVLNYEVPRLLDVVTYPVLLTLHYGVEDDPGRAFAAGLPLLVLVAAALLAAEGWADRRGFALTGTESPDALRPRGRPGPAASAILSGWLVVSLILPVGVLLYLTGGLAPLAAALQTDGEKVAGSALVALAAAILSAALAAAFLLPGGGPRREGVSQGLLRGSHRRSRLEVALFLAFALPGVLLGFALARIFSSGILYPIYDSPGILVLAATLRFFPLALLALGAYLRSVPEEEWDAADLIPGTFRRWSRVRIPRSLPGLRTGAVAVALLASGELPASLFVAPPGHEPLMVRIYNLIHYDAERDALAALALLHVGSILIVCAILGVGWRWIGSRRTVQGEAPAEPVSEAADIA
jgi:iron(III) transport system permease protein